MEQIYKINNNSKIEDHQILIDGFVLGTQLIDNTIKIYGFVSKNSPKGNTTFFVYGYFDEEKATFFCIDKDNSTKSHLCTLLRDRDIHDGSTERVYNIVSGDLKLSIKMEALLSSFSNFSVQQVIKEEIDEWINDGHHQYKNLIKHKEDKPHIKYMKRSFMVEEEDIAL